MSYYRIIDGQRYKAALLEAARAFTEKSGDGRISRVDAEKLLELALDGRGLTLIEQKTLSYIQTKFKWTDAALRWFQESLHKPQQGAPSYEALIEKILSDFDLERLQVMADPEEIQLQQSFESTIIFETSFREALRAFIEEDNGRESPRDVIRLVEDLHPAFFPNEEAFDEAVEERITHYMVQGGKIMLIPFREGLNWDETDFSPPKDRESVVENWIFSLVLPALSDHVYWSVIDRKAKRDTYAYGSS